MLVHHCNEFRGLVQTRTGLLAHGMLIRLVDRALRKSIDLTFFNKGG